tara:strand:+ start:8120 stop:8305 length:186 start_codon:yes stop_codon:yes gene_type:complete
MDNDTNRMIFTDTGGAQRTFPLIATKKHKYKEIKALLERASELLDTAYVAHLENRLKKRRK